MTITEQDIAEIHRICQPLIGERVQSVETIGCVVNLCFGKVIERSEGIYGSEWLLKSLHCAWRLQTGELVIISSEDPSSQIAEAAKQFVNKAVRSIEVTRPSLDTTIYFDDGLIWRLFPIYTTKKRWEHWLLFTPDHYGLKIGTDNRWVYRPSNVPYEWDDWG